MIGKHLLELLTQHSVRPLGFSTEELRFASRSDYGDNLRAAAVGLCFPQLQYPAAWMSAGCKRRTATRNGPKLKSDAIGDCCGESVPPNSEDLLDVVGIAESLDLNRQWRHIIAWVHGPHRLISCGRKGGCAAVGRSRTHGGTSRLLGMKV